MGWFDSKWLYKSYTIAKYVVGEEVYLTREIPEPWLGTGVSPNPPKYIVTTVSDKPTSGLINKEFVYSIKNVDTNEVRTGVYESEMRAAGYRLGFYRLDYRHMDYQYVDIAIPRTWDKDTRASLYNDNILELTYDIRTNKFTLWFDPTVDRHRLAIRFSSLMWQSVSQGRALEIQNTTITDAFRAGLSGFDQSEYWSDNSAFRLMVRFQLWLAESDEYQDAHLPGEKIVRLVEEPPEDPLFYRWERKCVHCSTHLMWCTERNERTDKDMDALNVEGRCAVCGKRLNFYWVEHGLPFRYERGNDTYW